MSTKTDKISAVPRPDNIKGLVGDLFETLNVEMASRSAAAGFGGTPGDRQMFIQISRHPASISEIARRLGMSRQAAHAAVRRLARSGYVELDFASGSQRDKVPRLSEKGLAARRFAAEQLAAIEDEMATRIGKKRLEQLRRILLALLAPVDRR